MGLNPSRSESLEISASPKTIAPSSTSTSATSSDVAASSTRSGSRELAFELGDSLRRADRDDAVVGEELRLGTRRVDLVVPADDRDERHSGARVDGGVGQRPPRPPR